MFSWRSDWSGFNPEEEWVYTAIWWWEWKILQAQTTFFKAWMSYQVLKKRRESKWSDEKVKEEKKKV